MPFLAAFGFLGMLISQPVTEEALNLGPLPSETETLGYDPLYDDRMTVPVLIDGQGPFQFIIDTGAERTVISSELAARLGLDASEDVVLSSLFDVRRVPTVMLSALDIGRRTLSDIQAPALSQYNLGAEGALGIDALEDQHVVLDFENREMQLRRTRVADSGQAGERVIVVRARNRLGRLVIADARVDGTRVYAIIDTGSSVSIGNSALRERLVRRGRMPEAQSFAVTSVTGATANVNYTIADRFSVGGVELTRLPVAFADAELFRQLDLLDRPAILLGMNALRAFDRVSIDFASGRVRIEVGGGSGLNRMNYAALERR